MRSGGRYCVGWKGSSESSHGSRVTKLMKRIDDRSVLKMTMLVSTGRPLPSTPLPGREIDPSLLPSKNPSPSPLLDPEPTHKIAQITSLSSAPLHTHVIPLNESLPPSLQTAPEDLLPRLRGGREWLGEMMNATEGLVAVLTFITIARRSKREGLGRGKSSLSELARSTSTSTIVPLLYILISRTLRRRTGGGKGDKDLTCLLAETYAGRDRELLWYFLRGSLWQNYMRIKGMRVLDGMSRVWGLGLVAGLVRDHLDLVDDLFYCESHSLVDLVVVVVITQLIVRCATTADTSN
jgi:peroxin-16